MPYTAVRQSIGISAGSPFLLPSYDLFTRTVTYDLGANFHPSLLFRLSLPVAEARGAAGFRAYDGAPLDAARTPELITFMTSSFTVPPEPVPPFSEPSCAVVTELLASRCASACCHGGDQPILGLSLESAERIHATAIRRVARQTEKGNVAGVAYRNAERFGLHMPIIDPASAPTSYLVYKLLVHERNLEPCSGPSCPFDDLPGARNCSPLEADEVERMKDWFVTGEAMPIVRETEQTYGCAPVDPRPLDCGSMRAIERWIENGALCP